MTDRANIYVKPGMKWLGELISSAIGVDFDEQCPRCGSAEQATHHPLCQPATVHQRTWTMKQYDG